MQHNPSLHSELRAVASRVVKIFRKHPLMTIHVSQMAFTTTVRQVTYYTFCHILFWIRRSREAHYLRAHAIGQSTTRSRTRKHLGGQTPEDGDEGECMGRAAASERSLFYRLHATYFVSRAATNLLPFTPLMLLLCTRAESTPSVAWHFRSIRRYSMDERASLRARSMYI